MLRIAFAGTPDFAVPALDALAASEHTLVGVLTQPDRPAGRGRQLTPGPVKQRALALGLPVDQPDRLATEEQRATLRSWAPELLVVVAYGLILPRAVLELPRLGCLNIHASLLPRWRGAAPIQRAVLAGDSETGVCIRRLEEGLDTGPVYAEQRMPIGPDATAASLQPRLAQLGAAALLPVIADLVAGRANARPQPQAGVTYARKIRKEEARVDWHSDARQIALQVRAFNPWPVAETLLDGERLRLWRAHPLADTGGAAAQPAAPGTVLGLRDGELHVACGAGTLAIAQLQPPGKRAMPAADFMHGHGHAPLHFT
jgi:methionyl-tRNA formyltransferase